MTAVVALCPAGYPTLIGDLVLSSETPIKYALSLPTYSEPSRLSMASERVNIVGLRQKLVVINPRIAVGWSGSFLGARIVCRALSDAAATRSLSLADVRDVLNSAKDDMDAHSVAIVGFVSHEHDSGSFGYRCSYADTGPLGTVRISGSGEGSLRTHISRLVRPGMQQSDDATQEEHALGTALLLAGGLLAEEMTTQDSLRSYFGGGYEMCTLDEGGFAKRADITYVWWTAEVAGTEVRFRQPMRVLRPMYTGDVLIVRALDIRGQDPDHEYVEELYAVPPLLNDSMRAREVPLPEGSDDLNTRFSCHMFTYTSHGQTRCFTRAVINDPEGPPVRFLPENNDLRIIVQQDFREDVTAAILAAMP